MRKSGLEFHDTSWVGNFTGLETPPHPKTLAFCSWLYARIRNRIEYCTRARATTLFFDFDGGNDTTGNGTLGNPYKTQAKASSLIAASNGDIAVLFKPGTVDTTNTTLSDANKPFVLIGSWWSGVRKDRPILDGNGAATDGILIRGDGACVMGLHVKDWVAQFMYPIRMMQEGTDIGLVMECEVEGGKSHCIGTLGDGGGVHVIASCRVHSLVDAQGTYINGYATAGGNEYIVTDCSVTINVAGAIAVYGHTGGGTRAAMVICNNLQVNYSAGGSGDCCLYGDPPLAASAAAARFWEVGTRQEVADGATFAANSGLGVRINCFNKSRQPGYMSSYSGWAYNCIGVLDGSITADTTTFFNRFNSGNQTWRFEHCHFHWVGMEPAGLGGFEWWTGGSDGSLLENTIMSADASGLSATMTSQAANLQSTNGNAWYNFSDDGATGAYGADVNRIDLKSEPVVGAMPWPGSQLYRTSRPSFDGVRLEYDFNWNRRKELTSVGPVDNPY